MRLLLATALGLGLAPVAPGTFGTLLGVLIHVLAESAAPSSWVPPILLAALGLTTVLHIRLTPFAQEHWKSEDPGNFVLDEVAGYLTAALLFPYGPLWPRVLGLFLLFRLFDIVKPQPARYFDRSVSGPWGILMDDIVAGGYAAGTLYVVMWIKQAFGG